MKRNKYEGLVITVLEDNAMIKKPIKKYNKGGRSKSNRPDRYGDCASCLCTDCRSCYFNK